MLSLCLLVLIRENQLGCFGNLHQLDDHTDKRSQSCDWYYGDFGSPRRPKMTLLEGVKNDLRKLCLQEHIAIDKKNGCEGSM